jgi:hypothetical protein
MDGTPVKLAPSILSADFARLRTALNPLNEEPEPAVQSARPRSQRCNLE